MLVHLSRTSECFLWASEREFYLPDQKSNRQIILKAVQCDIYLQSCYELINIKIRV